MSKKIFDSYTHFPSHTTLYKDGKVIVIPEKASKKKFIPKGKASVSQDGELTTYDDGEIIFEPKASREQGPSRYTTIYGTPHAEVKEYPKSLIVSFKFDRTRLKGTDMSLLMCEESELLYKMLRKYNAAIN